MGDSAPGVTTYRLTGSRQGRHGMRVEAGEESFEVDADLNPIQYLLGSLIGCLNATASMVAREMGVDIAAMDAEVEGDVDYSRFKGEDTNRRAGLQEVRVELTVDADTDEETLEDLLAAVEERCPVSETLANGTDLGVTVEST
jgi:uncharacterized OsmC-like protein